VDVFRVRFSYPWLPASVLVHYLFIKWADILLESGMFGDLSASISIIVQIEVLSIWPVHSL